MHEKRNNRDDEHDVDQGSSDVKAKAQGPKEDENEADDCEHNG